MEYLTNTLSETGVRVLFFGLMAVVFYFFMIRPKQKEEQRKEDFLKSLKKGKEVITIGGLHGTIVSVGEKTVVIEIDRKGSQLTVEKVALSMTAQA